MKAIRFPRAVLEPIEAFLRQREVALRRRKEKLTQEDPYNDPERSLDLAAVDTEANDRVHHDRVAAMTAEVDKALQRIRLALLKIDRGEYGVCERCLRMIDTDRLAVDPAASLCVDCEKQRASA